MMRAIGMIVAMATLATVPSVTPPRKRPIGIQPNTQMLSTSKTATLGMRVLDRPASSINAL